MTNYDFRLLRRELLTPTLEKPLMSSIKTLVIVVLPFVATFGLSTAIGNGNMLWVLGTLPGIRILLGMLIPGRHSSLIATIGLLLAGRCLSESTQILSCMTLLSIGIFCVTADCLAGIYKQSLHLIEYDLDTYERVILTYYLVFLASAVLPSNSVFDQLAYVNRKIDNGWVASLELQRHAIQLQRHVAAILQLAPNQPEPKPARFDSLSSSQSTFADMKQRVQRWKASKEKLSVLITSLQKDREELLGQLDKIGIKSVGAAATNPRGKVLLEEFRDVLRQLALYQKKLDDYDLAVFKSESQLRTIERRIVAKEAGVSEVELAEMTRNMLSLEESLSSEDKTAVPLSLDDVLVKELASVRDRTNQSKKPVKNRAGSEVPIK